MDTAFAPGVVVVVVVVELELEVEVELEVVAIDPSFVFGLGAFIIAMAPGVRLEDLAVV